MTADNFAINMPQRRRGICLADETSRLRFLQQHMEGVAAPEPNAPTFTSQAIARHHMRAGQQKSLPETKQADDISESNEQRPQ